VLFFHSSPDARLKSSRLPRQFARPRVEALEDRTLLATNVLVQAFNITGGTPTATDNDFTRINNAIQAATAGETITLQGNFNWTESHAAASWAADNYGITAPSGLDGVTLTAANLGSAQILGPGATPGVDLTGVFFFNGPNTGWTISNLRLVDFDFSIGFSTLTPGNFSGTKILNNYIKVATNLNTTQDPAYLDQNIGLRLSFGQNQTIQGNTFEFNGDGVSDPGTNSLAEDIGIQTDTSAHDTTWDGLLIDHNTFRVLRAQSANPEKLIGIWENTYANGANITISNNQFLNQAAGNNPTLNDQIAIQLSAHSTATSTVTYSGNTIQGAHFGFLWYAGVDFSDGDAVRLWQNTIKNTDTAVFIQSKGAANLWRNTITGSHTAAVEVTDGGRLESSGPVTNAVQENFLKGGTEGILVKSDAGAIGSVYDNDLSGNSGFALDNQTATTIQAIANWWGTAKQAGVAAKIQGPANFNPFLLLGDDTQPATPGFQGDFRGGVQFVQQPTGAAAGQIIAPPVTVEVLDIFGKLLTTGSSQITLALSPNAVGATLGGTTTRPSQNGIATFNNLFVTAAGTFTMTATIAGLPPAVSQPFTISALAASRLVFLTQPPNIASGGILPPIVVQVADKFGNPVKKAGVTVTVSLFPGVLFGNLTMITNALGQAVFTNLQIFATGPHVLIATASGLAAAQSQVFNVLALPVPNPIGPRRRWV
jgi:hypothetical protein